MHTHIHTYTHTHTHTQEYLRKHVSKHKNHGNRQGKSGYYFVGASLPQSAGGVRLATMEIVARLGASDISTLSPDALAYVRTCKLSSTSYVRRATTASRCKDRVCIILKMPMGYHGAHSQRSFPRRKRRSRRKGP